MAREELTLAYENDEESARNYLDNDRPIIFEPFSTDKRLCAKFPHKRLHIKGFADIIVRPSFSIPFIKPPNMIPNVDEIQLKMELTLQNLGGIKPEAPWIK